MKNVLIIADTGETNALMKFVTDKGYSGNMCSSYVEAETYCRNHSVDLVISEMNIRGQSAVDYFNDNYDKFANKTHALPIIFYDGHNFTKQMQDSIISSLEFVCYE